MIVDDGRRAIYEVSISVLKAGTLVGVSVSTGLLIDLVGVIMKHYPTSLLLCDQLCATMDDHLKAFFGNGTGSLDTRKEYLSKSMLLQSNRRSN